MLWQQTLTSRFKNFLNSHRSFFCANSTEIRVFIIGLFAERKTRLRASMAQSTL